MNNKTWKEIYKMLPFLLGSIETVLGHMNYIQYNGFLDFDKK